MSWLIVHYTANEGVGFEKMLLRADAGGAGLMFVLIYMLSELIGYTFSSGFTIIYMISLALSVLALVATGTCAIYAIKLHNKYLSTWVKNSKKNS
ncbi:MAG: hypothetical protein ABFD03_06790 [Clostridiaceae bacterium]